MTTWAIVPVKPLNRGKSRLSSVLSVDERAALMQNMFLHVVSTLKRVTGLDEIMIVSRDEAIIQTAEELDVRAYTEEDPINLNNALTSSAEHAWQSGADAILIVPSDLGLLNAEDVDKVIVTQKRVVICPDDKFDGTNALLLRDLPHFQFRYGEQSFMKHLEQASLVGETAQVVYADSIEFDLDTPADWQRYEREKAL